MVDRPPRRTEVKTEGIEQNVTGEEERPPSHFNPDVPACYAHLKHGRKGVLGDGRCYNASIWNGYHYTRCRMHGGHAGRPPGTGQYSEKVGKRVFELASEMENDQGLTAIEEQVKLAAAVLLDHFKAIESLDIRSLTGKDVDGLLDRLDKVSKLIERRHKIREGNLYTVRTEHFVLVVHAVAEAINSELSDYPELRDRLAKRIGGIRVLENEPKGLPPAQDVG